ncbi:unnamed protein product [Caenorhabditis bovis]|uniref:Uncharacterized protein n=1 Tax=Caenorhabditis bovis TaxID=2654633 RepID=A0A8S1F767_9PELO|nr:unnamed protein product [Caenorhabditis bovis]
MSRLNKKIAPTAPMARKTTVVDATAVATTSAVTDDITRRFSMTDELSRHAALSAPDQLYFRRKLLRSVGIREKVTEKILLTAHATLHLSKMESSLSISVLSLFPDEIINFIPRNFFVVLWTNDLRLSIRLLKDVRDDTKKADVTDQLKVVFLNSYKKGNRAIRGMDKMRRKSQKFSNTPARSLHKDDGFAGLPFCAADDETIKCIGG